MINKNLLDSSEMQRAAAHIVEQTLETPAKETGTQLATLIDLLFTPFQAAKIYRDAWIEDYKNRINVKFHQIPAKRLQAPPLNIVGPALEASKFHIATEKMREMFANLVAHACDQEMTPAVHPSFINILTQISALEARLLADFRPRKEVKFSITASVNGREIPNMDAQSGTGLFSFPEQVYPIVNYYLSKENERMLVQNNVMASEVNTNTEEVATAVTNLIRLGLVETSFQMQVTSEGAYSPFYENDLYQTLCKDINPGKQIFVRCIRGNMIWGGQYNKIVVEKGVIRLTQLGYNFIKVCVLEKEVINQNEE